MSQPYYSDCSQQQYYSDSYDSANNMHPPIQHNQSHAPVYGYQNEYYDTTGVTSNAQAVDNSSTLAQTYSYSDENYTTDTTDTTADTYSSYNSVPNHTMYNPDSVGQIPHQYGDAAPGHTWTGPAQYTEVTTVQPDDLHDQRRGSCASMATADTWYSNDSSNGEHYGYTQPASDQQNYGDYYQQQPEPAQSPNYGMYSPTSHSRVQELARAAPYESTQWMPVAPIPQANLEAPYGTLPIRESNAQYECQSSDSYQQFDNGPIGHSHPAQTSPMIQQHIQQHPPSIESHHQATSPPANSPEVRPKDLYIQQRRAASYQHGLRVQQELKYQLSGHLEQLEATRRRQESFTIDQNYSYTLAHDTPHHQSHPAHHQRQGSSSSEHRLPTAPIVPSQAPQRTAACSHSSPAVEEKKDSPPKKPALACLFCRKRKIACGPPPPDNPDRTCNQCARRKQECEYPTESRRGIRKTQREPVYEEPAPTLHHFVHGDDTQHEFSGPIRHRRRKQRAN